MFFSLSASVKAKLFVDIFSYMLLISILLAPYIIFFVYFFFYCFCDYMRVVFIAVSASSVDVSNQISECRV